ncbi:hypothetical protein ACFOLJ_16605 [Rugamonas sp. CCM 8940]|uniref:hypothetical protein n=1 Tax=Rugamonas sp. CCM 8940 TaxID=2765359 RepID=UPI0018F42779|nr:hypothetical protein [Rugamonas sp. CCM 8940]MBJ7312367.1 hypothetical protein [Rugamonas sp. CCM 8940]
MLESYRHASPKGVFYQKQRFEANGNLAGRQGSGARAIGAGILRDIAGPGTDVASLP